MAVPVTGNVCVGVRRGARAAARRQYTFCLWWWLPADWTGTVTFPASLPDVTLKTKPDMGATALFLAEEPRFSSMEKATLGLACEEQVERVEKFLPCSWDMQGLGTGIRKPWGHTCRTWVLGSALVRPSGGGWTLRWVLLKAAVQDLTKGERCS